MNIQPLLAGRVQGMKPSPIRKLVPIMRMPGMISLGGGYPNAQTFAFTSLDVVFKSGRQFKIRDKAMDLACQYGPTDASADLKPHIIRWHAAKDGVALERGSDPGAQRRPGRPSYHGLSLPGSGRQRHPVGTRLPGGAGGLSRIHRTFHSRSPRCPGDDHDRAGKNPGEEKSRGGKSAEIHL